MDAIQDKLVSRFLRYTGFHTTSDPNSDTFPSTRGQMKFATVLANEMESIGLLDVELDVNGYVMATFPATMPGAIPVVGFIAHYDTSCDFNGEKVHPRIVEAYDGTDIVLHAGDQVVLSPDEFSELLHYKGHTLITTDGTSLLGADDKAGIAEILSAMEELKNAPVPHGKIRICFTPDEEIGRGTDRFDIGKFGADFAFTVDGGEIGELEYENFNAALATVTIKGKSVHPGAAKDHMVNALLVAQRFISMLPEDQRPENTAQYEGFFHLVEMSGKVAEAKMEYLIRDHDALKFRQKKEVLEGIVTTLNASCGYPAVQVIFRDQYYNMREKIEPVMFVIGLAEKAMKMAGVEPRIIPIRGGTDGARLSWDGLPCPNIFTGGLNYHGPYEFIPVSSMVKAVEVIRNIAILVPEMERKI
jgi:tripeptide aminopeptidase